MAAAQADQQRHGGPDHQGPGRRGDILAGQKIGDQKHRQRRIVDEVAEGGTVEAFERQAFGVKVLLLVVCVSVGLGV